MTRLLSNGDREKEGPYIDEWVAAGHYGHEFIACICRVWMSRILLVESSWISYGMARMSAQQAH